MSDGDSAHIQSAEAPSSAPPNPDGASRNAVLQRANAVYAESVESTDDPKGLGDRIIESIRELQSLDEIPEADAGYLISQLESKLEEIRKGVR